MKYRAEIIMETTLCQRFLVLAGISLLFFC